MRVVTNDCQRTTGPEYAKGFSNERALIAKMMDGIDALDQVKCPVLIWEFDRCAARKPVKRKTIPCLLKHPPGKIQTNNGGRNLTQQVEPVAGAASNFKDGFWFELPGKVEQGFTAFPLLGRRVTLVIFFGDLVVIEGLGSHKKWMPQGPPILHLINRS